MSQTTETPLGDATAWLLEFNVNGQFTFWAKKEIHTYGLAGLNIGHMRLGGVASGSDTEIGLNIGGGGEYVLDFAVAYAEFKFVISEFDQAVISGGLRWDL